MLLFHSSLKVIWGNGSFCVGEYVMQEQAKNISFCFHSNSHASISLNSLIHSFSLFVGFVQFAEVQSAVYSLCLQMCVCSLFWQQSSSSSLLGAALARAKGEGPNPMCRAKGQQLPSAVCFLLCALAHAPADPKTSEDQPWQPSPHGIVL